MSTPRGIQVLGKSFLGRWPLGTAQQDLMIDMKRVNMEVRREALAELEEDVAYRNRVKQRMREGSRCPYPPLIDREKVLQFAARTGANGRSADGEAGRHSLGQAEPSSSARRLRPRTSQPPQVAQLLPPPHEAFRRLQHHGKPAEATVAQQPAKRRQSQS